MNSVDPKLRKLLADMQQQRQDYLDMKSLELEPPAGESILKKHREALPNDDSTPRAGGTDAK